MHANACKCMLLKCFTVNCHKQRLLQHRLSDSHCLAKFDTDKMNFEPILNATKNRDTGYKYF